jgi:hypothetical protein
MRMPKSRHMMIPVLLRVATVACCGLLFCLTLSSPSSTSLKAAAQAAETAPEAAAAGKAECLVDIRGLPAAGISNGNLNVRKASILCAGGEVLASLNLTKEGLEGVSPNITGITLDDTGTCGRTPRCLLTICGNTSITFSSATFKDLQGPADDAEELFTVLCIQSTSLSIAFASAQILDNRGTGLEVFGNSTVEVLDSAISGNVGRKGGFGGGVGVHEYATLTIVNSFISKNTVTAPGFSGTNDGGGGLFVGGNGHVTLRNTTVERNSAERCPGGGISLAGNATLRITDGSVIAEIMLVMLMVEVGGCMLLGTLKSSLAVATSLRTCVTEVLGVL